MRYKSIELYNYAGLYNGLGLNHVKIDFTKCVTNKIIIKGKNGSGKSTLLNAINPNPDSNDNFIPNEEARKIIVITEGNIDYIIRYIHPISNNGNRGTTKGYISKSINGNMVELNPNGNISSCKDILYEEFNLDSNYLSLSKLTSEDKGLVGSKPAERKKLVSSIISNLETYNNIYKILSKKSSTYKSLVNSLTYKIDSIGNEAQLNARLKNIMGRLSTLEDEKSMTIETIAAVKIKIAELINLLKDNNYDSILSELKELNSTILSINKSVDNQLNIYNINDRESIKSFMDDLERKIFKLEDERDAIKNNIPILLTKRESEFKELQSKQEKLNSLQSDYNYMDIKQSMEECKKIIEDHESVFKQMKLININLITKSEFDSAMSSLKYLKESAYNIISSYSIDDIKEIVYNRQKILENIRSIPDLKNRLDEENKKYSDLLLQYNKYQSKKELISELSNRPEKCDIDDCPYIKNALDARRQYPDSLIQELEHNINECENNISYYNSLISKYTLYNEILNNVVSIERELNLRIQFIQKLPVRKDFKDTFLFRICNLDKFEDIDELYKFVDCGNLIEEYKIMSDQLHKYEIEYKLYESKIDIISSILSDIDRLSSKLDEINNSMDTDSKHLIELEEKISNLKESLKILNTLYSKITDVLIPSQKRYEELNSIKLSLDNNAIELNKLEDELSKLNTNLTSINNDINGLSEEKDSIKHSLVMLDQYITEMNEYKNAYTKIEKIRYYSSSSTGIQTLYMEMYMNKILNTANDLLSLLFDSEFVLKPFVINEQEFRIPCIGTGLLHDDISSMSTAQKSMISMILSYSIIYQSSSKYNIVSLDEMDGSLDGSNRSYFMTLLDKLMSILKCEQCFIISHNNELISEVADLIILKPDKGTSYTGNVIWSY